MKYVLDASVAVASLRPHEPWHGTSVARISGLFAGEDHVVVPAIFSIDAGSALARAGVAPSKVGPLVDELSGRAEVITIGPKRASELCDFLEI